MSPNQTERQSFSPVPSNWDVKELQQLWQLHNHVWTINCGLESFILPSKNLPGEVE
jgi:hypothetical protein